MSAQSLVPLTRVSKPRTGAASHWSSPFPMGHAFEDVEKDDFLGQFLLTRQQRTALSDVATTDYRNLVNHNVPHSPRNGINTGTLASNLPGPRGGVNGGEVVFA